MKVLCIDDTYLNRRGARILLITKGTWYEAADCSTRSYLIKTDRNTIGKLDKNFFKTIQQLRQDKLEQLCN